jgi:hypothetical protein
MTRATRQILAALIAILSATLGIAFVASPELTRDPQPPDELRGMIAWLAEHPADWLTASAIADRSLDSQLAPRESIWRRSHELAAYLAPRRLNTSAGFVRAGLFHWYELDAKDRAAVLQAATALLREPSTFGKLYIPLFDLTRDFAYLRRNAPRNSATLYHLGELAVTNGLFAEYRDMRSAYYRERWAEFQARRHGENPTDLVDFLPRRISTADEPVARGILEELDRKPFNPQHVRPQVEELTLYAIRHRLQPLAGLAPLVEAPGVLTDPTRARLALALGKVAQALRIENMMATSASADWVPYYLDRARVAAAAGDVAAADGYLARAAVIEMTDAVLATAAEIATALGQTKNIERYRHELVARSGKPRVWTETCAANELCSKAVAREYVADGRVRINASVVQSDQIAPYLEIYIDDALVAEGEVRDERAFTVSTTPVLHRIEVRLVNGYTRNRIQRRVRLS